MCHLLIIRPGNGTSGHKLEPACNNNAHSRPPSIALWLSIIYQLRPSGDKSV